MLLLAEPVADVYAMLGIAALDDAPVPLTAAGAVTVAERLVPSPWSADAVPVDLGAVSGWRVTLLDPEAAGGDEQVAIPRTVSTVYVVGVHGRLVVAALTSLPPLAAAVVQVHADNVVATFDVEEGPARHGF
ncbi:hypothetical protein DY023_04180 [Microbacterium bovistercoris]|uniref:Uncharacterized protein n=1 Tax=Microbacterium bovistercoris TaxID=2293570 RepID=A0A371NW69_9MICO|nr:hypothetical protein DY023_04180 [Microbacterium bovistercoris]